MPHLVMMTKKQMIFLVKFNTIISEMVKMIVRDLCNNTNKCVRPRTKKVFSHAYVRVRVKIIP